MSNARRAFIAQKILSWALDNDQELARKIAQKANEIGEDDSIRILSDTHSISRVNSITEQEIREFLDPWVKNDT